MIDILNIINLPEREDRLASAVNQCRWQKVPFRIWDGITQHLRNSENISEAHKQIIRYAKEEGLPRCIIAEDDIIFTSENSWKYFLENIPNDYDIFLSMLYAGQIENNRVINGFSGMTLYCVHERFYDFFLSISNDLHIDRGLGMYAFEKKYMVCNPYVARQSGGFSNNMGKVMTYEVQEKSMTFLT